MKLLEACAKFIAHNRRIRHPKTAAHYRLAARQYCEAIGSPDATIHDLSDDGLVAMEKHLLDRHAIPTVNSQLSRVKAIWRWLAQRQHLQTWPTIARLPEPEPSRRAWDIGQLRALLDACERTPGEITRIPACDWWRMWHLVQWETGERTGGMLALRWEWLTADGLDIPGTARKGGKAAYYRLSNVLLDELRAFADTRREMIFPWNLSRASFWNHYGRLLLRAKLPATRKDKPQKMRRSHLTWWLVGGGDPTSRAKHASAETTRRHYIDERLVAQIDPAEILPAIE